MADAPNIVNRGEALESGLNRSPVSADPRGGGAPNIVNRGEALEVSLNRSPVGLHMNGQAPVLANPGVGLTVDLNRTPVKGPQGMSNLSSPRTVAQSK